MKENCVYDYIIVYETDFQKTIVDTIIQNLNGDILIVDARFYKIEINGKKYDVNVNGFKNTILSLKDLFLFPRLKTKELICTAFTGINSRLFPALIDYDHLSLIDDGSGTPAILKNAKYPWNNKYIIRFVFSYLVVFLLKGCFLNRTKTLIKRAQTYYSIYKFVDNNYSIYTKSLEIEYIDYFSKYCFNNVLFGTIGYISGGSLEEKNSNLSRIIEEKGKRPIYFPHPIENTENIDKNLVEKIIRPNCILEEYFMHEGIPEIIYGDPSTVFINLCMSGVPNCNLTIFYTKMFTTGAYYDIFRSLGVNIIEVD